MREVPWRRRLASHRISFAPPASREMLSEVEGALGLALPAELRSLLAEADGVQDGFRTPLVWPAAEIAAQNRLFRSNAEFRALYMPFDALLFFGEAGNGDRFFYRILGNAIRDADVYRWDHETDSRVWLAPSLERFLDAVLADAER